jgi:hypothetical protein
MPNMFLGGRSGSERRSLFRWWGESGFSGKCRENYIRFGACARELSTQTRPPNIDEVPAPWVILGLDCDNRSARIRPSKTLLLGVVRSMLVGRISILNGCTAVSALAWNFSTESEWENFAIFNGVASEIEDLPNAATRHLWSPEALKLEDAKAADYERRVKAAVEHACIRLKDLLQSELLR